MGEMLELAGVLGTLGGTGVLIYFGIRMANIFTARIERRGGPAPEVLGELDDLRARVIDLEGDRTRLIEVEERLDFAERLLTTVAQPAAQLEERRES